MAVPSPNPSGSVSGPNGLRPDLAPPAALLAMALDLAGELLLAQVDRVPQVARAIVRAQGHTLQSQGGLRHLVVGDGRIALLVDLDLETRELRHLLAHLREPLLDVLAELVGHGGVATLDLDLHTDPLGRLTGPRARYPRVHVISTPAHRRPHTRRRPPLVAAPKRMPRASRPWCAHRRPTRRRTVDRRARGRRCDPAPGAPRATNRPGASALPRGPGRAPPARPVRAADRRGQAVGVVEAAHAPAQRMGGNRHERGRRREQSRRSAGDDLGRHRIGHAEGAAELQRVDQRARRALEGDRRPRPRERRARRRAAPPRTAPAGRSADSARRAGSAAAARQAQHSGWPAATAAPQSQHAGGASADERRRSPRASRVASRAGGGEHPPMLARACVTPLPHDCDNPAQWLRTLRGRSTPAPWRSSAWPRRPTSRAGAACAPRTARARRPSAACSPSPRACSPSSPRSSRPSTGSASSRSPCTWSSTSCCSTSCRSCSSSA